MNITYTGSEPIRINKFLLHEGICSRRQADRYIEAGELLINSNKATLGDKLTSGDTVTISSVIEKDQDQRIYIAFNKPRGIVSHNPTPDQESVQKYLSKLNKEVYPLGRLDRDSHGLMVFSNDGTIVNKLLHPDFEHEKEYIVSVNKPLKPSFERRMSGGLDLGNFITKPCIVEVTDVSTFRIILTEGKKHQIRRMCDALGYAVTDLKRIRISNIKLGPLEQGSHRTIRGEELKTFLADLV